MEKKRRRNPGSVILRSQPSTSWPCSQQPQPHTPQHRTPQAQPDNSVWRASESGSWWTQCKGFCEEGHLRDWLKRTENILVVGKFYHAALKPSSRFLFCDSLRSKHLSERQGLLQEQRYCFESWHCFTGGSCLTSDTSRARPDTLDVALLLMSTETFSTAAETYLHF